MHCEEAVTSAGEAAPCRHQPRPTALIRLRQYWRFYWPLALTGVAMVLAMQFQNGVLARYPDAVAELAVFALASSTFGFFNAGLNFTAQLANVYARSARGKRMSHGFVSVWS